MRAFPRRLLIEQRCGALTDDGEIHRARQGARNLLLNCIELRTGDRLLSVLENPELGWYQEDAAELVAVVARELGAEVTVRQVGGPDNRYVGDDAATDASSSVDQDFDCCLFFARMGDQMRFDPEIVGRRRAMCYVTSRESLASNYGCIQYQALADLKTAIDRVLYGASEIVLTCPLGTTLRGNVAGSVPDEDVTVHRFPVGVHAPLDAVGFAGEIYLARYLTPTGSRVYEPASARIDHPVVAKVSAGRIIRYTGEGDDLERVNSHYTRVSDEFDLDPTMVLSWHAGIHPGCHFVGRAVDDPDKWSNTVFTSPRFAHFHTCGQSAPGEICWMVLDPTISVDGIALWEEGRLHPERLVELDSCIELWPELNALYQGTYGSVGLL
jgi:hypothetical protein